MKVYRDWEVSVEKMGVTGGRRSNPSVVRGAFDGVAALGMGGGGRRRSTVVGRVKGSPLWVWGVALGGRRIMGGDR